MKRVKRMEEHEDNDEDMLMELACTDDFEEYCETGVENEEDAKNVEDKIRWAAGIDEAEFRDGVSGRLLDPMKARSAREEELKELERRVCQCIRVTGKKPIGVRWVYVDKGFGVRRSRLVAKEFRPKSRVNVAEELYAATPPLELLKFLLTNAATSSRGRNGKSINTL